MITSINEFKLLLESKTDRYGNQIGDGSYHTKHIVYDFNDDIKIKVSKAETTESVYVNYYNIKNNKSITVRFSDHSNNATLFGDQLDGNWTTKNEVAYKLGLIDRKFIPNKYKSISSYQVKRKDTHLYEESDLTIQELYALPIGTDISEHKGKLAKGSNRIISGDTVEEVIETTRDRFGNSVQRGEFVYDELK